MNGFFAKTGRWLAVLTVLAACEPAGVVTSPAPTVRPARPAPAAPAVVARSEASLQMQAYYARVQQSLLTLGLLRGDGGGPDTPFNQRQLVDNFIRIALFEEYSDTAGKLVAGENESRLHRWSRPVRMQVSFGISVPLAQRTQDRAFIANYTRRLSRISGLPITQTSRNPNFVVHIVNEDERRKLGPSLRATIPGLSESAVREVQNMGVETFCVVLASDPADDENFTQAVAVIRAEHPDRLRNSCIHEEIAQGLGLSNDSPAARPSIFNDDEEFGLLTTHDELLLRMLYDPRLQTGMAIGQARPIAEAIAQELLGGES